MKICNLEKITRQTLQSVTGFTAYIMLAISDNCRLHVGQVVIRLKMLYSRS